MNRSMPHTFTLTEVHNERSRIVSSRPHPIWAAPQGGGSRRAALPECHCCGACHHSAVAHVIRIAAAESKSNADYTYTRKGNAQNVATPVEGGVALEGGGTDVSQAFQWMITHMGGKG